MYIVSQSGLMADLWLTQYKSLAAVLILQQQQNWSLVLPLMEFPPQQACLCPLWPGFSAATVCFASGPHREWHDATTSLSWDDSGNEVCNLTMIIPLSCSTPESSKGWKLCEIQQKSQYSYKQIQWNIFLYIFISFYVCVYCFMI